MMRRNRGTTAEMNSGQPRPGAVKYGKAVAVDLCSATSTPVTDERDLNMI